MTASADKRIESGLPYRYKKETIIKLLEITEEELKDLPFLSTAVKSKKERKAEANRRAYEKRLEAENKQNKEAVILERRAVIFAMRESGATARKSKSSYISAEQPIIEILLPLPQRAF